MSVAAKMPSDEAPHLLVVDDDRVIRQTLARFLTNNGYRVTTAEHAKAARGRLNGLTFDLLILDVMMPGETGFDLARAIRAGKTEQAAEVPILMLTARSEPSDRITGLEIGADDYLPKPFEPRELILRIGGILRRAMPVQQPAVESVRFGDFHFHIGRLELKRGDELIRLTDREKDMLRVLSVKPGETVPRYDLAAPGGDINERTVDVQVNRLRRKIEVDPANPTHLQTVRGIGYRLISAP
ncbi:response regulator [Phreatobacter aquaticus]|uniref:Response regulator n=1 Tax=Phreatobacter aquaticus TaxID=2570229 RepID=A0A4D7QLR2_9HYPH|nr:response regulator [Phreatobacter aquaticus]QCK88538.1 response regulator [Phreatobacter aquaticus]